MKTVTGRIITYRAEPSIPSPRFQTRKKSHLLIEWYCMRKEFYLAKDTLKEKILAFKTEKEETLTLLVEPSYTIDRVKSNIADKIQILPDQQRLLFANEELMEGD